jgi:hypothetical protein
MAGDWLKFDKATPDKPEVFAIAAELEIDPDAVVGKLMRVWSWFDTHTENGNAPRVTSALLDRCAGVTGFVSAMQKSGWMVVEDGGCRLPNFDRHCGETAKSRGLGAKRAAAFKTRNAPPVTSALPREEKRREEIPAKEKAVAARGARLPADWVPTETDIAYATTKGVNWQAEAENFADFWHAKAGKDACKTDWGLTWKTWVRRAPVAKSAPSLPQAVPVKQAMTPSESPLQAALGHARQQNALGVFGTGTEGMAAYSKEVSRIHQKYKSNGAQAGSP